MKTKSDTKKYTEKEVLDGLESYLKKHLDRAKKLEDEQLKLATKARKSIKKLKAEYNTANPEVTEYGAIARAETARDFRDEIEDDIKKVKAYKNHKKLIKV